ncbi:MAG: fibronectin type III domain-containing protein [Armatimonadota bacterium]
MAIRGIGLLAAIACIWLWCGPSSAANNRPLIYGMNPIPMEWWGYNPLVWDPLQFRKMAEAGCASARIGVNWDQIEPVKGQRDWSGVDRWINYCLDNNIEPLILINSTPTWALPDNIDPNVPVPTARYPAGEDHVEDFNNWCFDLARRFRGRARYYEFWNEANGYGWYTPWDPDPSKRFSRADLHTPWLIRCYKAVKLADPGASVSTTGIDDGGDGHAAYFLNLMYQYGAKGYFDAVADHPYPTGGLFQAWKLDAIRACLDSNGDSHVKVWITEFGYPMDPGRYPDYQQYMSDYFNTLTQDAYDYVRIATWHTATEFPWEFGYGLMNSDLTPKPPYTTFKDYPKPARAAVSGVTVTALSATSVRIGYSTSAPARGLVMYGPDQTYGFVTARETTASTSHQHTLIGLLPGTTYHFRIRTALDGVEDGDAFSQNRTFTTPAGVAVRIVDGPTASEITSTAATVTWTTDVPSDSTVEYGETFAYGGSAGSSSMTTTHSVRLSGLAPGRNYQYRVISAASGYASGAAEGRPFTTLPENAGLVNGGFESGLESWTFWEIYPWGNDNGGDGVDYPGHISVRTDNGGVFIPSPPAKDGSHALGHDVGWASAVGGVYQTIDVPNGAYMVAGWVHAGCDGGDELVELRAIDGEYTGGIPGGVVVARFSSTREWTRCAGVVDVTTGKLTVATRISQWWAVSYLAGHFDGIVVAPCTRSSISDIKARSEGEVVATDGENVVSAVFANNTFYIQDDTRCAGIRVRTTSPHGLTEGDRVAVAGILRRTNGETVIEDAAVIGRS